MRCLLTLAFSAALLAAVPVHADELVDVRSQAMQGGLAAPRGNASIHLNPAGVALGKRYEISTFAKSRPDRPEIVSDVSIMDSLTTGEVGGGLSWQRRTGGQLPTDDFGLAMAQNYGTSSFGIGAHYVIDRERQSAGGERTDWNFDLGVVVDELEGMLKVGAAVYNILNAPKGTVDGERTFAAGLASAWAETFQITADIWYRPDAAVHPVSWSTGLEVWPIEYLQLYGGYGQFPAGPDRSGRWSVGTTAGEPGYWQIGYAFVKPTGSDDPTHAASLSIFLFND